MPRKRWTLLLLDDGSEGRVRQISLPEKTVRRAAIGAFAGGVCVLLLLVGALVEGSSRLRVRSLANENRVLSEELERFQGRVAALETTFARLAEKDSLLRTVAGMDALDDEVLEVGVGGPGLEAPEEHPLFALDPDLGESAFAVRYDLNALERRAELLGESMEEAQDSLSAHRALLEATPSILPTAGRLSSRFSRSRFHPIHNRTLPHQGVDLVASHGSSIFASASGVVVKAGWSAGLGQMVEIDHGFGFTTRYGHASKLLVRRGQRVKRGDVIAQVGNTGIATSSHLHYEVRINGVAQNPMNYVLPGVMP